MLTFEESKRLKMFSYDPFDYRSIVDAVRGCQGLFYCFEPSLDQQDIYDVRSFECHLLRRKRL